MSAGVGVIEAEEMKTVTESGLLQEPFSQFSEIVNFSV